MSGTFCPECQGAHFKVVGTDLWQCEVCGWEGNLREFPRKLLSPEIMHARAADWAAKKEGKLFFLRVKVEGADADRRMFDVMDALKMTGCSSQKTPKGVDLVIRFDGVLPKGAVEKIKAINSVASVRVV